MLALGVGLLVAGATIAPTTAAINAMAADAAPVGTATEAFAWLVTAESAGAAMGNLTAGAVTQSAGAQAAFALAGVAGTVAVLAAVLRVGTVRPKLTRVASPQHQ